MQDSHLIENDFINRTTEIIEENLSNERFGVSELASETGMSRSNLLRKIKKLTKLSASQFIRQVRLKNALEMLKQSSLNVSEVSYKVGFGSTSYFIKCFHDYYGYPPGEVGNRNGDAEIDEADTLRMGQQNKNRNNTILISTIVAVLIAIVLIILFKPFSSRPGELEKSIAVLPFKNDSNDSSNVHIINGLMESILNNLQTIEDLRVISRTSVEKYRNNPKTIPEIANELNVNYFVEGSGQKIGDQILLHIQLIEAHTDRHLWSEQYDRDAKDIFKLQMEVAKNIADKIRVIITPEEEERINKVPTGNLVAYDLFLKGLDLMYKGMSSGNLEYFEEAITYYKKAIENDNEFALAYADLAITYFFLDAFQAEKKYSIQINYNADNALLHDSKLAQSLIAKAVFYINNKESDQAVPYLEKALEYNPNSALVINILSDFYVNYIPDTEKYLEYALKGISLDIAANDSLTSSFIYLHISNSFMQTGFINEAEEYINKSLEYSPENLYSEHVKAFVLFAKDGDLQQTKELLIEVLKKDPNRYDIMKDIGMICYYMRDYECAYQYYKQSREIQEYLNRDISRGENAKIALAYSKIGLKEESEKILAEYKDYADNDNTIYKHLSLAMYYSYIGNPGKAIENLEIFSHQDNYPYLIIPLLKIDPLVDNIKDLPEFNRILKNMETNFWKNHNQIKASLEEKELL